MLHILLFIYLLGCVILSQVVFRQLVRYYPEDNTWKAAAMVVLVSLRWPYTLFKMLLAGRQDAIYKEWEEKEKPNQKGLGRVSRKEEKEKKG